MKQTILFIMACALMLSCQSNKKNNATESSDSNTTTATTVPVAEKSTAAFDLSKIPLSDKNLGKFPYLIPPVNYKYGMGDNGVIPADIRDPDREYFAVDGKLRIEEGKTYKQTIEKDRSKDDTRFNSLTVEKSFKDQLIAMGGVEISNKALSNDEIARIGEKELIERHYGYSIDFNGDNLKTYIIKTKDKVVWIQFTLLNEESGKITVLEKPI